jgi:hypothetical protein
MVGKGRGVECDQIRKDEERFPLKREISWSS